VAEYLKHPDARTAAVIYAGAFLATVSVYNGL